MVIRRSLRDMVFKTYLSLMGRYGMHEKCPSVIKGAFYDSYVNSSCVDPLRHEGHPPSG